MIAAGFGCRRGARADDVLRAFALALEAAHSAPHEVGGLYSLARKQSESGLRDAARRLGHQFTWLGEESLTSHGASNLTHSAHSLAHAGLPSVAESCALAGARALAGPSASVVLLAPRVVLGAVTCALARPSGAP
jgi:cobalt-precorrin 5A hydrolase